MIRRRLVVLALSLLLPLAASAQDDVVKPILKGEKATIVFSPNGGYAAQNFLKRYEAGSTKTWATQNGAVSELIRRAPKGSKVRIGAFKLSDQGILDAIFEALEQRNLEVKLWLKGPPGLEYMVPGHEAIAKRANDYLRRRTQLGKQAVWGDIQVQIGTRAKMNAFGKINDMHEKFAIVALDATHGPGKNHAILGTSNFGSSSDAWHNEHRVFLLENPKAAQRLWGEFGRLWQHLGECKTFVDGDASKGKNETPEGSTRIKLPSGDFADEKDGDTLQLRFTYEKRGGSFHKISDDFVRAIQEARHLEEDETVWVAQFGFGITKISRALLRAARDNPKVKFRVMVHMKEGDTFATRQLAESGLLNLQVMVKWDSHKLKLRKNARPGLPGPTDPGPNLLHHKILVVGHRTMITGSFNFFSDADDQGEQVLIVRNHLDDTYEPLLDDAHAELEAMASSGVLIDAKALFGNQGLYETIRTYSGKPGFLRTIQELRDTAEAPAGLLGRVQNEAPNLTASELDDYVDVLEKFKFAEREAGKVKKTPNPDEHAFKDKDKRRANAKEPAQAVAISGVVTLSNDGLTLVDGSTRYLITTSATAQDLRKFADQGLTARVLGVVTEATGAGPKQLAIASVVSPQPGSRAGVAGGTTSAPTLATAGTTAKVAGPIVRAFQRVQGKRVTVRGFLFTSAAGAVTDVFAQSLRATVTSPFDLTYNFQPIGHRVEEDDVVWIERASMSSWVKVRAGDHVGYMPVARLNLVSGGSGLSGSLNGATDGQ